MLFLLVASIGCVGTRVGPEGPAESVDSGEPVDSGDPIVPIEGTGCRSTGEDAEDAALYANQTLDFALEMTPAAIAGLATNADEDVADVPGIFTYDGQAWDVGVRLRGGRGSFEPFVGKPGFALDFGFAAASERFKGLRYLTLKNNVQDDGMLAEHVAYALSARMGVPAPRHGFARLTVNDELFGLYGIVESVESPEFVARCFGGVQGPLYEGQMDDLETSRVDGYTVVLDGGLGEDALAPLHDAIEKLDAVTDPGENLALDAVLDLETLERFLAVEVVTGNPDGYVAFENNYYLYHDPSDERLRVITWGPDQAFWEHLDINESYAGRLWTDCRASTPCSSSLDSDIRDVAEFLRSADWLEWLGAVAERTEADCLGDPRSPGGAAACIDGRDRMFAFLTERPSEITASFEEAR